jgi:hypothetical protein
MLNFCGIVVAILKMVILYIEQFLPVAIFKMATTNSTLPDFNAISHVGRCGDP